MVLEEKAKAKLDDLLKMSEENFEEMSESWDDLKPESEFTIKDSQIFLAGYVCGKIEHKFVSWFYSEFGRSQTDKEYKEFWRIVKKHLEKMNAKKWQIND